MGFAQTAALFICRIFGCVRGRVAKKHTFLRVFEQVTEKHLFLSGFELENEVSWGQVTQKHVFLRVFEAKWLKSTCFCVFLSSRTRYLEAKWLKARVFACFFWGWKRGISRPSDSKARVFTCVCAFFRGDLLKLHVFACFQAFKGLPAAKARGSGGREISTFGPKNAFLPGK